MGGSRRDGGAAWATGLRGRVERWRVSRQKGSAMPGELWESAAALAEEHGVYAVSRELRLSYESLRRRAGQAGGRGRGDETGRDGFVEVRAGQLLGSFSAAGAVVEVWDGGGARLSVRLGERDGVDVVGLVGAFLGYRG